MGKLIDAIKRLFGLTKKEPEKENLWDKTETSVKPLEEPTILFKTCGHYGPHHAKIVFWDRLFHIEVKEEKIKTVDGVKTAEARGCPNCFLEYLKKHAIRCCLCGGAIVPGDPVALYRRGRGINKKKATYVDGDAVGCTAWECCPSSGFFAGYWTENGFQSAFGDGLTLAGAVLATGKTIVVGDSSDPSSIRVVETPPDPSSEGNKPD